MKSLVGLPLSEDSIVHGWAIVLKRGKFIDPDDEHDWSSVALGFCLAVAGSIDDAKRAHARIHAEGLL